jgi:hypothetical protein
VLLFAEAEAYVASPTPSVSFQQDAWADAVDAYGHMFSAYVVGAD